MYFIHNAVAFVSVNQFLIRNTNMIIVTVLLLQRNGITAWYTQFCCYSLITCSVATKPQRDPCLINDVSYVSIVAIFAVV